MTVEIRALQRQDDRSQFGSGDLALDHFFQRYAGQNQFRHHLGATYVAVQGSSILGFATVAPGSLDAEDLPSGKKMPPYPLPILRVARLAVDQRATGQGLGKALLRYCVERAERLRDELGCVGVVVDAKPGALEFYLAFGFQSIDVTVGAAPQRPATQPMFLPLGSVPRL